MHVRHSQGTKFLSKKRQVTMISVPSCATLKSHRYNNAPKTALLVRLFNSGSFFFKMPFTFSSKVSSYFYDGYRATLLFGRACLSGPFNRLAADGKLTRCLLHQQTSPVALL